jgi:hypothetical protein
MIIERKKNIVRFKPDLAVGRTFVSLLPESFGTVVIKKIILTF